VVTLKRPPVADDTTCVDLPPRRLTALVAVETTADAARLGSWLALLDAAVLAATGWYVDPRGGAPLVGWLLTGVGGFTALALGSARFRWDRLPRRATLAFPVLACALLALLGLLAPEAAMAYAPLLTLWTMYVGLTAPRGAMLRLLPVVAATWLAMTGLPDAQRVVRLGLTCVVWVVVAEVLALRTASDTVRRRDLTQQAETDPLTGLGNRRALHLGLDDLLPDDVVAVIDLDHFKRVNDARGHQHGDEVLVDFADALRRAAGPADVVTRFGGEEFVLLLRGEGEPEAAANAVLGGLRSTWPRVHPSITWSAGVSVHRPGRTAGETLAEADAALYEAKRQGRNRVCTGAAIAPAAVPAVAA
jgi:diguanylate cyclase (GGDEF)-like protein